MALTKPALRKIEYYKIHKEIYGYKREYASMLKDRQETLLNKMPIYSKKEIIQIKNGNIYPVLSFNAAMRPNSASCRVLKSEMDPANNLKKKYYKNSNKPLGNNDLKMDAFYSKRYHTTL